MLAMCMLMPATISQAQLVIECVECLTPTVIPRPESGAWYDPDQPGTGFFLQVQDQSMLGTWYGYDSMGQAQWFLFSGPLQPSVVPGKFLRLNAELQAFEGGACVDCDYQPPESVESPGRIELTFTHRNIASVSLNGEQIHTIVPLTFGRSGTAFFAPYTTYRVPDIDGEWTVSLRDAEQPSRIRLTEPVTLRYDSIVERDQRIGVLFVLEKPRAGKRDIGPARFGGSIVCEIRFDGPEVTLGPQCDLLLDGEFTRFLDRHYFYPVYNVSESRIWGESERGDTFEMIRLSPR